MDTGSETYPVWSGATVERRTEVFGAGVRRDATGLGQLFDRAGNELPLVPPSP
jgi:hypothetical protein